MFALVATEELLRRGSTLELGLLGGVYGPYDPKVSLPGASKVLLRVSTAAPFLTAAAIAACVAWVSHRTLRDIPIESKPRADSESHDLTDQYGDAAEYHTNF